MSTRIKRVVVSNFHGLYINGGFWGTSLDGLSGCWINQDPVIDDFGDIAPFLISHGEEQLVSNMHDCATIYLYRGLYVTDGKIELFYNHDWIFGLLESYRLTSQQKYLIHAREALDTVMELHLNKGYLVDFYDLNKGVSSKAFNPFNGGYIELYLDLYRYTTEEKYLEFAQSFALKLFSQSKFISNGYFVSVWNVENQFLNFWHGLRRQVSGRLFKDNSNVIFSLLEFYRLKRSPFLKTQLSILSAGIIKNFIKNDISYQMITKWGWHKTADLKAGFVLVDLLTEFACLDINSEDSMRAARDVADFWISEQWNIGLIPLIPNGNTDHLDSNVDFAIALCKLYSLTKNEYYWENALKIKNSIFTYHLAKYGFVMSVNSSGVIEDSTVKVKYQGLVLKLKYLPETPTDIFQNELWKELKDR